MRRREPPMTNHDDIMGDIETLAEEMDVDSHDLRLELLRVALHLAKKAEWQNILKAAIVARGKS